MPKIYGRNCAQCRSPFQTRSNSTRCCSPKCGLLYRDERMGGSWGEAEDQKLSDLAGVKAFPDLVKSFQAWAKYRGLRVRSKSAIANRMAKIGLSRKATLDCMGITALAETLGVLPYRVNLWRRFYGMPCRKVSDRIVSIPLNQFQQWARENPQQLGGLDAERLEWVLGDRAFAEHCASLPRYRKAIPIKRLDTGVVYSSLGQAAKAAFLDAKTLSYWVARGDRFVSGGVEWEVLR